MDDLTLIEFLFNLLWSDLTSGDTPSKEDLDILRTELTARGIIYGRFPNE